MIIQEYLNPNSLLLIAIPVPSILLLASVPHGTVPQTPVSDHVLTNVTPPDSVLAQRENFSLISSHVLRSPHFKKLNVLIPIWSLGSQLGWLKQFCTSFSKIDWLSEEFSQIQPIKTAEIKCNQFGKKKGKTLNPVCFKKRNFGIFQIFLVFLSTKTINFKILLKLYNIIGSFEISKSRASI